VRQTFTRVNSLPLSTSVDSPHAMPRELRRAPTRVAFIVALWTVFGVLSALQVYIRDVSGRPGASLWSVFSVLYFYWAWAAVTPIILRLAKTVAADARPMTRRIVGALPLAAAAIALQTLVYATFLAIENRAGAAAVPGFAVDAFIRHFAGNLLTLGTIVAVFVAFRYYQATQRRLVHAAEMESSLASARLAALRAQLQPHFLFNTLNLISGLVATGDAPTANRAIARLGDLLRATLDASPGQTVSLEQELDLTRRYLEIARLRFGDRLVVEERIADDTLAVPVPMLLLQPLVENALEHATGARERGGSIAIEASRRMDGKDARLIISVRDDGPGFQVDGDATAGIGLSNTRDRLSQLYGTGARLTTRNPDAGGAIVTVDLPA
jgi:two-component system, LytTR family, sensor kinase